MRGWLLAGIVTGLASVSGCELETGSQIPVSLSPAPSTSDLTGKVIKVSDGDTIHVLDENKQTHVIRMNGIDAPEKAQAFGDRSRRALADRIAGTTVRVTVKEQDRYGRSVADVFTGSGDWINLWMVREGWAWHYAKYSDDSQLQSAQATARQAGRGLWADPAPLAPWDFRNPPVSADDNRVYVIGSGTRYHRGNCTTLDARRRAISMTEARRDYTPCRLCQPPQ